MKTRLMVFEADGCRDTAGPMGVPGIAEDLLDAELTVGEVFELFEVEAGAFLWIMGTEDAAEGL
jgi:hypothetical protein